VRARPADRVALLVLCTIGGGRGSIQGEEGEGIQAWVRVKALGSVQVP